MARNDTSDTVAITGLGMVSSLGPDVASSCAAARAGITRADALSVPSYLSDHAWGDEPIVGHQVHYLTEGFTGVGRLFRLGTLALDDLLERIDTDRPSPPGRTAFYVNFPDRYFEENSDDSEEERDEVSLPISGDPTMPWQEQLTRLVQRLSAYCGLSISPQLHYAHSGGHVGVVSILADAIEYLRTGKVDRCIIGGIDSCIDAPMLELLAHTEVLKTAPNPAGFIGGEAAAFFLIERADEARKRDVEIGGFLGHNALTSERQQRFSDERSLGVALAEAIETSVSPTNNGQSAPGLLIGDLNGDPWRAAEWGHAVIRLNSSRNVADVPLWLPALSFGEVGAATGSVSICMGVRAFQRGYAHTDRILLWLSSEDGRKAAAQLLN